VCRFERIASIERFDTLERFAELSPCFLETEMLPATRSTIIAKPLSFGTNTP
jgi:hypothetical protein